MMISNHNSEKKDEKKDEKKEEKKDEPKEICKWNRADNTPCIFKAILNKNYCKLYINCDIKNN